MGGSRMTLHRFAGVIPLVLLAAACGQEAPRDTVRVQVEQAPDYMRTDAVTDKGSVPLTEAAQETIDELRAIIASNSLTRLARKADSQPGFISNFAGATHRTHWDLLRRTGFDPILRMQDLLDGPYGTKSVAGETWYIWPDMAAFEPEQLQPERLNFSQRARLLELVGESGIDQIRDGDGYPGVRMAIADDGRWLYYVHEIDGEE